MSLTYDEIKNTPDALRQTTDYLEKRWQDIETFIAGKQSYLFIGSGSSYCLAKSMALMTHMHAGLPSVAVTAGDLLLRPSSYAKILKDTAVVCISRSGKTSEILKALEAIEPYGTAGTAALICAGGTPLEERAGLSLNMPWAFDNSVCQTRTVTNFYYTWALILSKMLNDKVLADDLRHIAENCADFLKNSEPGARDIAGRSYTHSVVLADAELEGIAENAALAFKEICQVPSNYYHLLDSRHGPMVLFNKDTLLLAVLAEKDKLELDYIADMLKKGVTAAVFTDTPLDVPAGAVACSYGRKLSRIALGLPLIMLSQLVTYFAAAHTGANPDAPDGLSAWISL